MIETLGDCAGRQVRGIPDKVNLSELSVQNPYKQKRPTRNNRKPLFCLVAVLLPNKSPKALSSAVSQKSKY